MSQFHSGSQVSYRLHIFSVTPIANSVGNLDCCRKTTLGFSSSLIPISPTMKLNDKFAQH